mgnify:CR=1 FL=1
MPRTRTGNSSSSNITRHAVACILAGLLSVSTATAGDWPQILGPQRNGIASGERLAASWPASGPRLAWNRPVGSGFSGVAVADGRVFVFDREDDQERVTAVAAETGKPLWQSRFAAKFVPAYVNDNGPRCVPTVHRNRVVVFGAKGALHCLDVKTGKTIWTHDTMALFNSKRPFRGEPPEGYFGKGSSPIVFNGLVIVNAGGAEKNAGVVAFSLSDGKPPLRKNHSLSDGRLLLLFRVQSMLAQTRAVFHQLEFFAARSALQRVVVVTRFLTDEKQGFHLFLTLSTLLF